MTKKILIIHRDYRHRGGEDVFLDEILIPELKKLNLDFQIARLPRLKNPLELAFMILGLEKLRPSYYQVAKQADSQNFSHVLFNNFIPTVSLALPELFKKKNIKTLMWVHNARLSCANGLLFNGKTACHRCLTQGSRWDFLQNCHRNILQSFLYSFIYRFNRVPKILLSSIDFFACNSQFTQNILNNTAKQLNQSPKPSFVIRMPPALQAVNIAGLPEAPESLKRHLSKIPKPFYLFMGRVSYEKGADIFADLALKFPQKGFLIAGEGPELEKLKTRGLPNLAFAGHVGLEKVWLYAHAEALIVPSRVMETSSLVIAESHVYGTPVVYPKGGGAEETFKWLKRSGCSLEEFKGQGFDRMQQPVPENLPDQDFQTQLTEVFASI
jgi:glycosyltransferase involved in cell wall biosynthesis